MVSAAAHKYLANYAEAEIQLLASLPVLTDIQHLLAIPCYDETIDFLLRLCRVEFHNQGRILIILVVNQPAETNCLNNQLLLKHLQQWQKLWSNEHLSYYTSDNNQLDWIVCDKTNPGIPAREGVGTARKIAADIACWLWQQRQVATPWLHCSDADAHLPNNYFAPIEGDFSAITFAHKHMHNPLAPAVSEATLAYEKALHYYLQGLHWAGSPYAFSTIGSTLAINLLSYCQVRGFPKRNAAEDFYLLNKLAKIKPVATNPEICVAIESRLSQRVPFGTGPAVEKIMALQQQGHEYLYYAPQCFVDLRCWLDHLPVFAQRIRDHRPPLEGLNPVIRAALDTAGIDQVIHHLQQQNLDQPRALNALMHWFDGFRTLKFLRFLQSHAYPPRPLAELYIQAPFV